MLTALLAALCLQVPATAPSSGAPLGQSASGSRAPTSLIDTVPDGADRDLGLVPAQGLPPGVSVIFEPTSFPTSFAVTIASTSTGFSETFLVQVPPKASATPRPLLVFFHRFGKKADDVKQSTTFEKECLERNWFLFAPLGASKKHFSSIESQINTELGLAFVLQKFGRRIDRKRVYGVGFSMGGGACLNFAARHLDPHLPMFAALVNHTGGVALKDTYLSDPPVQWILEFWYGGSPTQAPFEYERSSLIDFDPQTLRVDPTNDLARNLTHVPVRNARVPNDPLAYLVKGTDLLHQHLLSLGGTSELISLVGFEHSWSTLDHHATCDWLAQHVLALPSSQNTLADHDATYFHFEIEQDAPGAFTPFSWLVDPATNRVEVTATADLDRVTVDLKSARLTSRRPLSVTTGTADGLRDVVRLRPWPVTPSAVLLDGVPAAFGSAWDHDPVTGVVTLFGPDGAAHVWDVAP